MNNQNRYFFSGWIWFPVWLFLVLHHNVYGAGKDTLEVKTSAVCDMCKDRIEQGLAFEKGIRDISLDLKTKIATVIYNPEKTSPAVIRKKISALGYDADMVEADPVAYSKLPACCKKDAPPH